MNRFESYLGFIQLGKGVNTPRVRKSIGLNYNNCYLIGYFYGEKIWGFKYYSLFKAPFTGVISSF